MNSLVTDEVRPWKCSMMQMVSAIGVDVGLEVKPHPQRLHEKEALALVYAFVVLVKQACNLASHGVAKDNMHLPRPLAEDC